MQVVLLVNTLDGTGSAHVVTLLTLHRKSYSVVRSWLKPADAALSLVWVQLTQQGNGGKDSSDCSNLAISNRFSETLSYFYISLSAL